MKIETKYDIGQEVWFMENNRPICTLIEGYNISYGEGVYFKKAMKVTKIIHKAMRPTDEGDWLVWCMVYINGQCKYQGLVFGSFEEARAVKEGQLLDIEKVRLRSYG